MNNWLEGMTKNTWMVGVCFVPMCTHVSGASVSVHECRASSNRAVEGTRESIWAVLSRTEHIGRGREGD
jgi:hypothetical protein